MKAVFRSLLLVVLALPLALQAASRPSRYLFVWAMESSHPQADTMALAPTDLPARRAALGLGRDFLAVFDVAPGPTFGRLVAMVPAGPAAMAHHTNYTLPADDMLYANDWLANRTYVFNLRQPQHPHLARSLGSVGGLGYPHSFVALADGNTLATFQYAGGFNHAAGGLVEFDAKGRVVRRSSAAVSGHPNVRPYSLAVVPSADRVVTSSADMMGAQVSHVVQIWRLSDLTLLQTLQLPHEPDWIYDSAADSSEPRVLADGSTVLVPTFNCGLFLLRNLAGAQPTLQHVYDFGYRTCEVPVVAGDFLVETMQSGHAIVSLDVHDPEHPREVGRILLPPDEYPHWLGLEPDGDRLAITGYGALATRVRFARVDRHNGALTLEPDMTIDLSHAPPAGWRGSAVPHGVVFSRPH
ncbi:MAG TPA: hypothetical protein VFR91_05365 [Dyella sp.]|nr:hypothetical protein [Dyella sp.]